MNAGPKRYPNTETLRARFDAAFEKAGRFLDESRRAVAVAS